MFVRDPKPGDEGDWRRLWRGYLDFYETDIPGIVTTLTWRRILYRCSGLFGRVAVRDGEVVGFTVAVLHAGSWTAGQICYLEDLFVDPRHRGAGIGRALIEDLVTLGRERGWSRLYWHTRASNAAARRLYDTFATADDFVRYRMPLQPATPRPDRTPSGA